MRPAPLGGAGGSGARRVLPLQAQCPPRSFVLIVPGALQEEKRCASAQVAARAQRASVEPAEVARYEEYDRRHGARYLAPGGDAAAMDEEDW